MLISLKYRIVRRPEKYGSVTVGEMSSTTLEHCQQYSSLDGKELSMVFNFHHLKVKENIEYFAKLHGMSKQAIKARCEELFTLLDMHKFIDQGIEYLRNRWKCPDWNQPVWAGNEFHVCAAAKMPLNSAPQFYHEAYGFGLAVIAFAVVYGAFAAQVLYGAMQAVPHAQLETAEAYGMTRRQMTRRVLIPQMWSYAVPGLSNLWMILIKATPLLFLLGIEDIVYWARELGATKSSIYAYPHGDWRLYYFLGLLVFYLVMTKLSEIVLARINRRLSMGQATAGGEALRKAGA